MTDMFDEVNEYCGGLIEELMVLSKRIREETTRFSEYRNGRYTARFEGVSAKLEGAAAKVEGIIARVEADRVREEVRREAYEQRAGITRESAGPSNEEKLNVLQMLENGTIDMEQAEELLKAM